MKKTDKLFLDIMMLPENIKSKVTIKVLEEYSTSRLTEEKLNRIKHHIISLLNTENNFTVIIPNKNIISCEKHEENDHIFSTLLSLKQINELKTLWNTEAGSYLVILNQVISIEQNIQIENDEEFIGHLLTKYEKILLKTPDGYEFLYLSYDN